MAGTPLQIPAMLAEYKGMFKRGNQRAKETGFSDANPSELSYREWRRGGALAIRKNAFLGFSGPCLWPPA